MNGNRTVIQWNIRGLASNRPELELLQQKYQPAVFCLQETLLKDEKYNLNEKYSLKGFEPYHKVGTIDSEGRAHGGVSIMVKESIPQHVLPLNTTLQAIAVNMTLNQQITVCSIYLPPSSNPNTEELEYLLGQLPSPYIIVGDFNAHNELWGGSRSDRKGKQVETLIASKNLCLWNDNSPTYIHPATGSQTSIDLSLCSPGLLLDFDWRVEEDLHGSDHFPIILESNHPTPDERTPTWNFHRADWNLFSSLCESKIKAETFETVDDPVSAFTQALHSIADQSIPKTSGKPKKLSKPWFDSSCKDAIRERKKALNILRNNITPQNLQNLKIWRARARRVIRTSKRNSWREFISKLNSHSPMKKCWDMIRKINGKKGAP